MATKFSNTDHYSATPAQIMAMLSDPDYAPGKYQDLGDVSFTVENHEPNDGGLNVTVDREVASNMPDLAKKVLGETTKMKQTEVWRADGDGYVGNMTIEASPVVIAVNNTIRPAGDGSDWTSDFEVKASVPLVGGKIEKMVVEETKQSLVKELAFNESWLANH
ncbi:MAG: DUF2505 domain-containing protein [Candidatus Nanopelagicales bacterium]